MMETQSSGIVVDKLYACQENDSDESDIFYEIPRSTSTSISLAKDHCCTATVFTVDDINAQSVGTSEVELAAFVRSGDSSRRNVVEISVHPDLSDTENQAAQSSNNSYFHYQFDHDVQRIKVLALPWANTSWDSLSRHQTRYQAVGFILVVTTVYGETLAHSIVLTRGCLSDAFQISESVQLTNNRDGIPEPSEGRRIIEMHAMLTTAELESERFQNGPTILPLLMIATASSNSELATPVRSATSQRVDMVAYPLPLHECPIFRFAAFVEGADLSGRSLQVLNDAGRVKALSITKPLPNQSGTYTLAILTSSQIQVVQLPPLHLWNGKLLPPKQFTTLLLAGCHPTHRLGEGVLLASVASFESIDCGKSCFAILCRPRCLDYAVTPAPKNRNSPALSPAILEHTIVASPTVSRSEISTSQLSINDTKNVIPKTRRELRGNSNKITPLRTRTLNKNWTNPGQPFDESINIGSPDLLGGKIVDLSITGIEEEAETSVITPSVLNMSERSISRLSCNDSTGSPLHGIDFLSGDTSGQGTPLGKRLLLPPYDTPSVTGIHADQTDHPDQLAHLVIVTVEPQKQLDDKKSSRIVKSFLASLPPQLSSFDAFDIKLKTPTVKESQSESLERSASALMFSPSPAKFLTPSKLEGKSDYHANLLLVVKPSSSTSVHFLGLDLTENGLVQSDLDKSHHLQEIIIDQLNKSRSNYVIKSLAMCETRVDDEYLRLRVLLVAKAENKEPGSPSPPINIALTDRCGVYIAELELLPPAPRNPANDVADSKDPDPVVAKLDAIMDAVRHFEINVNNRLDCIEKVLQENSNRITRIEQLLPRTTSNEGAVNDFISP